MFASSIREEAETELHDFLDQIGPASRHISLRDYGEQGSMRNTSSKSTNTLFPDMYFFQNKYVFYRCALELVLEKERESFWLATVEPALQLKEELNFRASQLRQPKVTVGASDQELVLQKVFV